MALRDLVLHEKHAACVDARGDVYQWGKGFSEKARQPILTLRGKVHNVLLYSYLSLNDVT